MKNSIRFQFTLVLKLTYFRVLHLKMSPRMILVVEQGRIVFKNHLKEYFYEVFMSNEIDLYIFNTKNIKI